MWSGESGGEGGEGGDRDGGDKGGDGEGVEEDGGWRAWRDTRGMMERRRRKIGTNPTHLSTLPVEREDIGRAPRHLLVRQPL